MKQAEVKSAKFSHSLEPCVENVYELSVCIWFLFMDKSSEILGISFIYGILFLSYY